MTTKVPKASNELTFFSWENYVAPVDPNAHSLREIVDKYQCANPVPCGLATCRTPHNRGFLVRISGDGKLTNIGHVCGKKYFGVDFDRSRNAFERAQNARLFRDRIKTSQQRVPALLARLAEFQHKQVQDYYERMQAQMKRLFDEPTSSALTEKAKRKDNRVTRAVRLSDDERQFMPPGTLYREEVVFLVSGIQAARSYAQLAPGKLQKLRSEIEQFAKVDAESLDYANLRRNADWSGSIDSKLDRLDDILQDCIRFLSPSNISGILQHKYSLKGNSKA